MLYWAWQTNQISVYLVKANNQSKCSKQIKACTCTTRTEKLVILPEVERAKTEFFKNKTFYTSEELALNCRNIFIDLSSNVPFVIVVITRTMVRTPHTRTTFWPEYASRTSCRNRISFSLRRYISPFSVERVGINCDFSPSNLRQKQFKIPCSCSILFLISETIFTLLKLLKNNYFINTSLNSTNILTKILKSFLFM